MFIRERERRKRPQKAEYTSIFDQKKTGQVQKATVKNGELIQSLHRTTIDKYEKMGSDRHVTDRLK